MPAQPTPKLEVMLHVPTNSPTPFMLTLGTRPTPHGRLTRAVTMVLASAALVVHATAADAQPPTHAGAARSPAADTLTLVRLECELAHAAVQRNMATYQRLLAPDYTGTGPDGTTTNRAEDMASIASGAIRFTAVLMGGMRIREYGGAAVVTGQSWAAGTLNSEAMSGAFRWTDVWIRRRGQWQIVATHVTGVADPSTAAPADQCTSL